MPVRKKEPIKLVPIKNPPILAQNSSAQPLNIIDNKDSDVLPSQNSKKDDIIPINNSNRPAQIVNSETASLHDSEENND